MNGYDIVISVGTKDCIIVKKTIKHIDKNIQYDTIYILTDIRNQIFFGQRFRNKYKVEILDENKTIPGLNFSEVKKMMLHHFGGNVKIYGWYFQQFLKMGFSLTPYAKGKYLIWDADTFPLRKLNFIEDDNIIFTPKKEYHKPYFDTMNRLLGIEKSVDFSYIAEHMMIEVSIMKELISEIQKASICGSIWFEKTINSVEKSQANGFSEFETYGTFCHLKHPFLYIPKEIITFREAGKIYGRFITNGEIKKLKDKYDTASFEMNHMPPFPKSILHWCSKIFLKIIISFRG